MERDDSFFFYSRFIYTVQCGKKCIYTNFEIHLPQHFVELHCQPKAKNLEFDWNQFALPPLFSAQNIKRKRICCRSFILYFAHFTKPQLLSKRFNGMCKSARETCELCVVPCRLCRNEWEEKKTCRLINVFFSFVTITNAAWKRRCVCLQKQQCVTYTRCCSFSTASKSKRS